MCRAVVSDFWLPPTTDTIVLRERKRVAGHTRTTCGDGDSSPLSSGGTTLCSYTRRGTTSAKARNALVRCSAMCVFRGGLYVQNGCTTIRGVYQLPRSVIHHKANYLGRTL